MVYSDFEKLLKRHQHHDGNITIGGSEPADPIDSILWMHIIFMFLAFVFIFPIGMIFGLKKSRWHVPTQTTGAVLTILGYFLGHAHKGRQFPSNIHSNFAPWFLTIIFSQLLFGVFLKGHFKKLSLDRVRPFAVSVHSILAKLIPIFSYIQIVFGGITVLGFCRKDHTGQCIAHFTMGSGFIAHAIITLIIMLFGQEWLKRQGRTTEFYDSALICAWGFVNTFTEHRWNEPWSHKDLQHTSLGVIWWAAGLLGIFLSQRDGPSRTFVPALVIILTGWAMSQHAQHLEVSTKVHAAFGWSLIGAGASRILEIIMKELSNEDLRVKSYQFMPPFFMLASGLMFMSANEEQLQLIDGMHIDAVTYVLLVYSVAFLSYLYILFLLHVYEYLQSPNMVIVNGPLDLQFDKTAASDAEAFELGNLLEEDESDEDGIRKHQLE